MFALSDTPTFQHSAPSERNRFLADLFAAQAQFEAAVVGATHEDQDRSWERWLMYCKSIGITDDFLLVGLTKPQRIKLMGTFAMALRGGRFSGPRHDSLVESTVRGAISHVASSFRDHERPNPTRDEDGDLGRFLSRLYRGFRNNDPAPSPQKALPIGVLREMAKLQFTESQRARSQLSIIGIFWACRPCEHMKVPQALRRRTDVIRLQNL